VRDADEKIIQDSIVCHAEIDADGNPGPSLTLDPWDLKIKDSKYGKIELTFGRSHLEQGPRVGYNFGRVKYGNHSVEYFGDGRNFSFESEAMRRVIGHVQQAVSKNHWSLYSKFSHQGFLRNLAIRESEATGEILMNFCTKTSDIGFVPEGCLDADFPRTEASFKKDFIDS
jgi:hypothetical protein